MMALQALYFDRQDRLKTGQKNKLTRPAGRSVLRTAFFCFSIFSLILKNNYDIVDAQTYVPLLPAWLGCRIKRIPIIATIHDTSNLEKDQWVTTWIAIIGPMIESFLYRLPYSKIVTVTPSVANILVKFWRVKPKRIAIIENGVDLDLIDSVPKRERSLDFIYIGRLIPHKHVEDLLNLVSRLNLIGKEAKAAIVGTGPLESELKKISIDLGVKDNVAFISNFIEGKKLIGLIRSAKILILPSTREGFGLVLAESMACETPVLAYRVAGVKDVVVDGKVGYLVEKRNSQEMFDRAIELLDDTKLRIKMGSAGRKRVENLFNWKRTVSKLEDLYKEVVSEFNGQSY